VIFAAVALTGVLNGCKAPGIPSDKDLEQRFLDRRERFRLLLTLCQEDSNYVTINYTSNWIEGDDRYPRPDSKPDLTKERWDTYRELFSELGLKHGYTRQTRPGTDEAVRLFIVAGTGDVTSSTSKGYAYSEHDLTPIYGSLDDVTSLPTGIVYKRIGEGWFLFVQSD
jgi:hypothetical protein